MRGLCEVFDLDLPLSDIKAIAMSYNVCVVAAAVLLRRHGHPFIFVLKLQLTS